MSEEHTKEMVEELDNLRVENKALLRFAMGEKPRFSTFIDEETVTAGYGELDDHGWWEYPLPQGLIVHLGMYHRWKKRSVEEKNAVDVRS